MFSVAEALALFALLAAAIVALHLIRPRATRAAVASNLVWGRVLGKSRQRSARWRWWLTLLLALAIGMGFLFAAVSPGGLFGQPAQQRAVLIIDNAPSMQARMRDGRSRFAHALEDAQRWLRVQGDGIVVRVTDTMGLAPLTDYAPAARGMRTLREIPVASFGTPRVPSAAPGDGIARHVFTDGVMLAHARGAIVHRVFEPTDNVAVTAFDVRRAPGEGVRSDALVQVFNASDKPMRARVHLRAQDGFTLARDLTLAAGELADLTLDVSAATGVLAAGVSAPRDGFALDDIAYALAPASTRREVLLVGPGDTRLEDALRALPGIHLTVARPADYAPDARYAAYVFDRFAPPQAPDAGSIVFAARGAAWLPATRERLVEPAIKTWDVTHPVASSLAWSNLRLRAAYAIDGGSALVRDGEGHALLSAIDAPRPLLYAGFAPSESNVALQPAFAAFLGQALAWVDTRETALRASPGQIEVPLANARITDGNARPVASTPSAQATRFLASEPDVYVARSGDHTRTIVVNRDDPEFARINRVRIDAAEQKLSTASARTAGPAPWMVVLAIVFALLLLDWAAWLRRVTA